MKTKPSYEKCGIIEDLEHKFKECKIIKNIWILITQIVKNELKQSINNMNKKKDQK